ncbi:GntR family transcriptional regulator [Galbitalea sp. SE-J8]|uniref:GntR family transcriptional regulator n=1 Tax=Galbitalea sp. SE-J8 TaxID=3054952 RepID=UPI00259D2AF7|nr:GntR family transcriptional regulator [Galbitalea sp. SE-J8]MDM4762459.1 GntR family transcriptional regulator [Galbitalea sp. SE-J8]
MPATSESAASRAYASMRARILDGELPGGSLVSENEIAAQLGVSRTPVREAFHRLQTEGWMQLYPKRGAVVVPIGRREARDVLEARRVIEEWAASGLDDAARAALAERLVELADEQERVAGTRDLDEFARLDARFHQEIVDAGGNDVLSAVYRGFDDRQRRMTSRAVAAEPARLDRVVEQHRRLAAALGAGSTFAEVLERHFADIHRELTAD